VVLRIILYIVMFLDEIFCRHQVDAFDVWCHLVLGFLCWFFCLDDLSIGDRGELRSPTTTLLESICVFKSFSVCLMKLGTLTFGTCRLIIVISFWCTDPCIHMKCPSLSHLINVSLKSTLSKYCYPWLFLETIGFVNLFLAFTLSQYLFLSIR
jgi:hypothetical protein